MARPSGAPDWPASQGAELTTARDPGRLGLWLALAVYLPLGVAYAWRTPLWQVPDEPAHYNYVAQVAADPAHWPAIEPGDYPAERLEALKATRFATGTVEGIAYEDHQPPAYYILAAAVWRVVDAVARDGGAAAPGSADDTSANPNANPNANANASSISPNANSSSSTVTNSLYPTGAGVVGRVHALRLLGVLLGALTVWLAWLAAGRVAPGDPWAAAATALVVAGLPMFVAMSAAVNNDALTYAVMAAAVVLALCRLDGDLVGRRYAVAGGLLGGLALVTKLSAYPAVVVLVAAEWMAGQRSALVAPRGEPHAPTRHEASDRSHLATLASMLGIAGLLSLPWFARSAAVYGLADLLGTRRHDAVVVGQARTADWIAAHGWRELLSRMATFTFDSFWGVFGWLGVFLDARIYQWLAAVTLLAGAGLVMFLVRAWRDPSPAAAAARRRLVVVAIPPLASAAGFVWWNLTFVQHQGRYLLYGVVGIALALVLGLGEAARVGASALGLGDRGPWLERAVTGGFGLGLAALAWLSLVRYVVPGLTP